MANRLVERMRKTTARKMSHPSEAEARTALETEIARLSDQIAAVEGERDALREEVRALKATSGADEAKAFRVEQLKALFAARGETFTQAAAAPLLAMTPDQFLAVLKMAGTFKFHAHRDVGAVERKSESSLVARARSVRGFSSTN